jgi:tetratricopeptide (TPR) repeat protein
LNDALKITDIKAEQIEFLIQIARSQKMDGRLVPAISSLERALALCREIGDRSRMIPALNDMALMHLQAEKIEEALECFSEALKISHETQNAEGLFNVI